MGGCTVSPILDLGPEFCDLQASYWQTEEGSAEDDRKSKFEQHARVLRDSITLPVQGPEVIGHLEVDASNRRANDNKIGSMFKGLES